ncbi:MAG: tetratricopeptide repeat protein [Flammeovirgaceae bacterium]|nr:tetratricopeptide repeat protein [Flammeovirgaceae bacterium]
MKKLICLVSIILFSIYNLLVCYAQEENKLLMAVEKSPHPDAKNCDDFGYCWGDNKDDGKKKFQYYSDRFNYGKDFWAEAEPNLDWLLENIPYVQESIYINGYKVYNHLLKQTNDKERKIELQNKILDLFDNRLEYFGDDPEVLERKGSKAYPFLASRGKENYETLFNLYKEIIEKRGNKTSRINLQYFMATVSLLKQTGKLSEEEVLNYHEQIISIIEFNKENALDKDDLEAWNEAENKVDDILNKVIKFDCEMINKRIGSELKEHPEDIRISKRALRYLIKAECYDDPLFLVAAEGVYQSDPKAGLARTIAKKYALSNDFETAIDWYEKALEKENRPEKKSNYLLENAKLLSVVGRKSEARNNAFKAVELDAGNSTEAYTFVGDLYMTSNNNCKGTKPVSQRLIYLAAYDMYKMAGSQNKMKTAMAQFPSIEEIFTEGFKEGESIDVGCWIGGTTTLRRRK